MLDYKNTNTIRIRDVADVFSGFAFKAEDLISEGIPVLKIANIQDKKVIKSTVSFFPLPKYKEKLSKYLYRQSDVLVAMTGEGSVGKVGKMLEVDKKYLVNQRVGILRPTNNIDPEYFYQVLTLPQYEEALYQLGLGAGQPNVSPKDIGSLYVPFPELPTQQSIASILSAYDDLIEVNNQRIKLLEETARELYKEWFVRMRFPGYKNAKFVKGMPEGWEVVRIGDIIKIKSGKEVQLIDNGLYKVYGSNGQIGFANKFNYEDVLIIGRVGAYCGSIEIGNSKIWATDNTLVAVPNIERAGFFFSYYLLKTLDLGNFAGGSAQPLLTQSIINRLKILAPSQFLVEKYEMITNPMFQQMEILQQHNIQLRQIRDRLLPRLISGKLEVRTN